MTTKDISIFGNSSHFEWRAELWDIILKRDHLRTIPEKFALIWFSVFRGEDLNVICYQNTPNLQNPYKSAERNISHFNLLLRNHWANCNQTLVEWSLDGPLQKCVRLSRLPTKMATKQKIKKRGMNFELSIAALV